MGDVALTALDLKFRCVDKSDDVRIQPHLDVHGWKGTVPMLTELSVNNFKAWKFIDKMRLSPITALFGTNSSGKSSILQLLLMIKQTIESSDRATVLEFGDDRSLTNLGSFREVIYNHETPGKLQFALAWERAGNLDIKDPQSKQTMLFSDRKLGFSGRFVEKEQGKLIVEDFSYNLGINVFRMHRKGDSGSKYKLTATAGGFDFTRTHGRVWDLPAPVKCYGFPDQVYAYYQNAGFLAQLQLAFEELFSQVYYLGPLRDFPQRHYTWKGSEPGDMGRRGERVVDAMLSSRDRGRYISPGFRKKRQTLEEAVAFWLKQLGLVHSYSVSPIAIGSKLYQVKVRQSSTSPEVLIPDVGFGVSQILPVIVLCYYVPEGSTILLEQPEIHLHPSVQSGLADVFIDVMKNRNVQIILESHSEHLLRRLQRRIAEGVLKTEETSLYFSQNSPNGSVLTGLKIDQYGSISNWPPDFFGDEFEEMAATTMAAAERQKESVS